MHIRIRGDNQRTYTGLIISVRKRRYLWDRNVCPGFRIWPQWNWCYLSCFSWGGPFGCHHRKSTENLKTSKKCHM